MQGPEPLRRVATDKKMLAGSTLQYAIFAHDNLAEPTVNVLGA